ncbi:hypothetical protein KBB76_03335 [Candidatus Saccharibacteria bacterium]|jgi:MtN3 and saliva related transmembrane protein|nr:hypothetical protein [Candidatus Saccharibacteria bacterium]HOR23134.1 SemiSWEET family transporter [Candidatus Saccharibacteria bacterium]
MNVEIIGVIAGAITTGAAIPQIIKSHKLKEVRDLSLVYYLLIVSGCALWLIYGIAIKAFALIFWNVIATTLNAIILAQKIYYEKN